MSLREDIISKFRGEIEKQNPWQPYRGDAGGEGWQNLITGEVRYQDERPAPEEGVPEDHEGEVPTPEEEPPDTLESGLPDIAVEDLNEGDEVYIEFQGEQLKGEVVSFEEGEEGIAAMVDTEDGQIAVGPYADAHDWDSELLGEALDQPPVEGWADGWSEPPDDHSELFSDQTVEVYDTAEGEYKEGEIRQIEEWGEGMYVDIQTEDDEIYEFLGGEPAGSSEGVLLTAAEDLYEPDLAFDWDPEDYNVGDEVAIFHEHTGQIEEGEVHAIKPDMSELRVAVGEGEDLDEYILEPNSAGQWELVSDQGKKRMELEGVEHIERPELTPETPSEMALHEGALAEIEHPAEGTVVGEVEIIDHGEKGRHLYVGDSEVGIPLDDPDHPLAQIEIGDVESQWYDLEVAEDEGILDQIESEFGMDDAPVDLGDEIFYGGETYTVTAMDPQTGEVELDGGEVTWSADEAASLGQFKKPVEMPDSPHETSWERSIPDKLKPDDTIAYLDEEGEISRERVVEDYQDGDIETMGSGTINEDRIRAWADTGKPVANQVDTNDIHDGIGVTIAEAQSDGSVETFEAYVTDYDLYGTPSFTAMDADGNVGHYTLDEENYGVVDMDRYADAGDIIETVGDWRDYETDEMVEDFYDIIVTGHNHGNYLSKRMIKGLTPAISWFFKEKQEELRTSFMRHFPPDEVESFYDGISNWKSHSGSGGKNPMLEEAFRQAMGSESRVRGEHEDRPSGPYPPDAWVKMAEVASEMSQWYYEDVVKPNTGGQLTRDGSSTSLRSFMLEWAENPNADEYGVDGRALNNFQIEPRKWNHWRFTPSEVPTESIGLMTDMMFNPMGTNDTEDEIWVNPDEVTFSADEVGIGPDRNNLHGENHLGGDISEWSEGQVETVAKEFASHYDDLTFDENEVYRPDELSDQQVETFLRLAERADDLGITNTGVDNFVSLVQAEAVERGITAPDAASEHPILESPDDLPEGTEVTMRDQYGDTFPGVVTGTKGGQLEVENADTGKAAMFDLEDIDEIVYAGEKYGKPAKVDMTGHSIEDFNKLEEVYVWSGGDWKEGKVLETEDGTVEVSMDTQYGGTEYFDEIDVQEANYVVPQDRVKQIGEEVEGGEGGLPEPGDYVEIEVPDSVDYDANAIMAEVNGVKEDGSLDVHHTEIPWLEDKDYGGDSVLDEDVIVDPEQYSMAEEPEGSDPIEEYEGDGFSEGTKVQLDSDMGFPDNEVTVGQKVNFWEGAEGTVVDVTNDYKPKVYIEDDGGDAMNDEGDVVTLYPSDDVYPDMAEPDEFGAITDGFDSIDDADAYVDDPVEYLDPDSGEVVSGEMTATFPSMDSVHIDGVEDPVHFEHVRPAEPSDEGISHDDIELGSNVVFDHFDPTIGTTEGTVVGYNQQEQKYIVDYSSGEGAPNPDELGYFGTNQFNDIKGEGEVNEAAVQQVSDYDWFTQDLPGMEQDYAVGDPIDTSDFTDLNPGDKIMVQITEDNYETAEVQGGMKNEIGIEFSDGSTKEIQSTTALDLYEAEDPDAEGSDEIPGDFEEGQAVQYDNPDSSTPESGTVIGPADDPDKVTVEHEEGYEFDIPTDVLEPEGPEYEVGESVSISEDEPGGVDADGEITDTMEIDDTTFYVVDDENGTRIGEYTAQELEELTEGSDEGEDFTNIPPEAVSDAGVGQGEEFTTTIPGLGETPVVVTEVSADPDYPVTVEAGNGEQFLIWDDGEVESV